MAAGMGRAAASDFNLRGTVNRGISGFHVNRSQTPPETYIGGIIVSSLKLVYNQVPCILSARGYLNLN